MFPIPVAGHKAQLKNQDDVWDRHISPSVDIIPHSRGGSRGFSSMVYIITSVTYYKTWMISSRS